MADYSRPAGSERFKFLGVKVNTPADAVPVHKYPYAQNVRTFQDETTTSRPQISQSVATPGGGNNGSVLSLEPTNGVYKIGTKLLVGGSVVDTGYATGLGAAIMPFRPNASPNTYDYVFDDSKSSKVYVSPNGTVTVQKVGIAEPQATVKASVGLMSFTDFSVLAASWVNAGTAGALSDVTRSTDTAGVVIADPDFVVRPGDSGASNRVSIQVGTVQYQRFETITVNFAGGGSAKVIVEDVLAPFSAGTTITIQSIFYFSGNTGRCIIVPTASPVSQALPIISNNVPAADSIYLPGIIGSMRRGSLIKLSSGNEIVMVLSVTVGPDGTVAIETSTVNNHAIGETITGVAAISVSSSVALATVAGQTITSASIQSTVAAGVGLITRTLASLGSGVFGSSFGNGSASVAPQADDYIHISLSIDVLANLTEIKLLFDVGDGSFTQNFYYFTIRPSDIAAAIANTQTQLGAASIAAQRTIISQAYGSETLLGGLSDTGGSTIDSGLLGQINIGAQTGPGASQWSEILVPVVALIRVGGDQSKTLGNAGAVQVLVNCTAQVVAQFGSVSIMGGGQVDVGSDGMPFLYRARPRNSATGAIGNPSPVTRFGLSPRRQVVGLTPPSAAYDTQIDTWDYFRFGGSITSWRYIGSGPVATVFTDNLFDSTIAEAKELSFDEFEPFPSIGQPITSSTATVIGTTMQATFPLSTVAAGNTAIGTLSQLGNLLPGTLVNIGTKVFTLFNRPTLISSTGTTQTYLFQFVECAGTQTNPMVLIQEPDLAAQGTNNVWGPDANGVFFAVLAGISNNGGSLGLRSGLIQRTRPNNPDSASDKDTNDLCPPSEPLQNGALLGPTPCVASPKRWWRGYVQGDGSYAWNEIPVGHGLAAQFGICSDGQFIYFVGEDGIYRHGGSGGQSLTDADLYNLFPHEGIFPQNITYLGQTIFAPEYRFSVTFRLNVVNKFLYFDYLDASQTYRTLVCDLRTGAWCPDVYSPNPVSIHVGATSPASNDQVPASAVRNQQLFLGDSTGAIYNEQSSPTPGFGESVACVVATREEVFGDLRANKQFGDAVLDSLSAGGAITATPVFFGGLFTTSTVISGGQTSRPSSPPTINILGQQLKRSMGLLLSWTDQGASTILYSWQLSYFTQPEDISNRITDWDNCGTESNKFIQGFTIEADSLNVVKNLQVRDGDNLLFHDFSSPAGLNQIKANGQQIITCSFSTPFSAHLVRVEPQDQTIWRLWKINWIYQPTPPSALTWTTQPTNFGLDGYIHAKEALACYASTQPVTLTITVFDGLSPSVTTLPSTGGAVQKILFPFSPNKGLLYTFSATSTAPWQCYADSWELAVKQWGSSGPYQKFTPLGAPHGQTAQV